LPGSDEAADQQASDHYAALASRYDQNWSHSEQFLNWMTQQIRRRLPIAPSGRVLDLGGGIGIFAERLLGELDGSVSALVLDPSEQMLNEVRRTPRIDVAVGSASSYLARPDQGENQFDAVLIKEAVHHFVDRTHEFEAIHRLISDGGHVLIVMLPKQIAYPLFTSALERFETLQPVPHDIAVELNDAGFETSIEIEGFDLAFERERYFSMVNSRYMSLLSAFTDSEIEAGIIEMRVSYPERTLAFRDNFAFITGQKR